MPRVLIVTSMFLPYLAADVHRARLLAAELPLLGWDVELLVPGEKFQNREHLEPNAELLAINAPVHQAKPEWTSLFRVLNLRSAGLRAYFPLRRLGNHLLSEKHFDLVFFSCSQPIFFHLGVAWRRKFGVPFVVDFHDPWYMPQAGNSRHLVRWKRRVANFIARYMERATLRVASGLISVSPKYLAILNDRYRGNDWAALQPEQQATIPFAVSDADYIAANQLPRSMRPRGSRTVVYTGAGGVIMEQSLREICVNLSEARRRSVLFFSGLNIQLYGTEPLAAGQVPALTRVILEQGMTDVICEYPKRLSYLEALRRVMDADGLFVLGVNDAAYVPSKLFLYGLTGKPLLACMRIDSVVNEYFDQVPGLGHLIHFKTSSSDEPTNNLSVMLSFLGDVFQQRVVDRRSILAEWLAPAMAKRHVKFFESCIRVSV
jgi:Glycosyl transferase 4-like domain